MKYSDKNPPLQLLLTNSTCYKGTGRMKPCGVLIHDTGAVNPNLKRYVQPADDDPNRSMWLEMLGKNQYNNDYNHAYRKMGVNCWVGMLADGSYTNFVHDGAGYGLFQATYWSIKEGLLRYAHEKSVSISDCDMQIDYFRSLMQTKEYRKLWAVLTTATSVREASDAVLTMFERPKDQSEAAKEKRSKYGEQFYSRYAAKPALPYLVRITDTHLNIRKGPAKTYASRGYIKPGTYTIVDEKDGFGLLKAYAEPKRDGWIMLKYTQRK